MNDHDLGLAHDLRQWQRGLSRRRLTLGALGAVAGGLAGSRGALAQAGRCAMVPEETAGPFPANGSGRGSSVNALALGGIVRSDIRAGLAGAGGVAAGAPLALTLRLVNAEGACEPLSGLAVYLWHCDREGRYSMYSRGVQDENYLRGVQVADADGSVSFKTVFPGCYAGRMPHLHFEVYRGLDPVRARDLRVKTSQIALPRDVCEAVYAGAPGYAESTVNLARITFATDGVFRDGVEHQLAAVSGSVQTGLAAQLNVGLPGS